MRAAFITEYGDPSVIQVADAPEPVVGMDTVLVEVHAAGVNPVDWKVVAGGMRGAYPHHLPLIPGWDVAGIVSAVGPAVTTVEPGDRVLAYDREDHVQLGTFAQRTSVPERAITRIPPGMSIAEAAALPLAGLTAEQVLTAAEVGEGDSVLVHAAAGGVGTFTTQLARLRGASVIGTASPGNHDHLRERGVTPVAYGDGLVDGVRALAPRGVDVVIDLVGGDTLASSYDLLADGGRVASIADPQVLQRGGRYVFVRPDAAMLARLAELVSSGELVVDIAATYPLEDAAGALEASRSGHTRGKVVITML
ncbi:NADP-dependent oxidoreductase [Solicola gregarius]|uniref:NADP-dependent oxidoreductase n=1 Tax=Solicola gregarius TaxID=2908642 RepID=A0AA46TE59_9ACTN|nr:NADP-dependent oxidoreductase [Solicola gregarius]UYM03699.1 NADP-dependent oxidoreductase [Solicola gregarius]